MIRVTVELVPHGVEERKVELGMIEIVNNGTGDWNRGNYNVELSGTDPVFVTDLVPGIGESARIEGFDRKNLNAWHLVMVAFSALARKGEVDNGQ